MKPRQVLFGLLSYIPGFYARFQKGTGGTRSPRYCYSVWLRHLRMMHQEGLKEVPRVVAELGPGDSIGTGLCALISGSEKYLALDVMEYTEYQENLDFFDEIVSLFRNRTQIPDETEFPKVKPYLDDYSFPSEILTDEILAKALDETRLKKLKLKVEKRDNTVIEYRAPWDSQDSILENSTDVILSQAVLEHVDDLDKTYFCFSKWLKPNGYMSHQIDFKSHGYADQWNGHWTYSDFQWKLLRGNRPYLLNRQPCAIHLEFLKQNRFSVLTEKRVKLESKIKKEDLSERFQFMSEDDLLTSGVYLLSKKVD